MKKSVKTAKQLLAESGIGVVSVGPDDPVLAVLQAMSEQGVNGVLVLDGGRLAGIVTERDYAMKVELRGRSARDTRVREIMTSDVLCAAAQDASERCMAVMHARGIRHLPVLEQGRVIGTLTIRDVLEEVVTEDEHFIKYLEHERIEYAGDTGGSY